jgi:hypothetical protein
VAEGWQQAVVIEAAPSIAHWDDSN